MTGRTGAGRPGAPARWRIGLLCERVGGATAGSTGLEVGRPSRRTVVVVGTVAQPGRPAGRGHR